MATFNRIHVRTDHEWIGDEIVYHTEFDGYQVVVGGAEAGLFHDDGTPLTAKTYDAIPVEVDVAAPAWAEGKFD